MSDLAEYIKHSRHFDGLGMGDQDLESRAKILQDRIKELEMREHHLPAKNNALRMQIEKKDKLIKKLQTTNKRYRKCLEAIAAESPLEIPESRGWTYTYPEMAGKVLTKKGAGADSMANRKGE